MDRDNSFIEKIEISFFKIFFKIFLPHVPSPMIQSTYTAFPQHPPPHQSIYSFLFFSPEKTQKV